MADETNGTRGSITPAQIWSGILNLAKEMQQWQLAQQKENNERDKQLVLITAQLQTIQTTLGRNEATDTKVDDRLEVLRDMLREINAATTETQRLVQEHQTRLGKMEDWGAKHEQFAASRDQQIRKAQQDIVDLLASIEHLRVNALDLASQIDAHLAIPHLDDEVPDVKAMLKDWRDDRASTRARWEELKKQLWTAPGMIVMGVSTATLGLWIQHTFHLIH